jgi:HlyD family secretion protein
MDRHRRDRHRRAALAFRPARAGGSARGRHGQPAAAASSGAGSASPRGSSAPAASGAPPPSGAPASSADALFASASDDSSQKTAYVLKNNTPVPVKLTVGVTDGSFTEIVDGPLKEGDGVIVEGPPADGSASGPPAGQSQGRPRMRGVF